MLKSEVFLFVCFHTVGYAFVILTNQHQIQWHEVYHFCFLQKFCGFKSYIRSLIHFEFMFVCYIRKRSNFFFLQISSFSSSIRWRGRSFLFDLRILLSSQVVISGLSYSIGLYGGHWVLSDTYFLYDLKCRSMRPPALFFFFNIVKFPSAF